MAFLLGHDTDGTNIMGSTLLESGIAGALCVIVYALVVHVIVPLMQKGKEIKEQMESTNCRETIQNLEADSTLLMKHRGSSTPRLKEESQVLKQKSEAFVRHSQELHERLTYQNPSSNG